MGAAAAALSRSGGVTGLRMTKGLFFIFALLALVCLASSLTDKDKLEKMKENLRTAEKEADRKKEDYRSRMSVVLALLDEKFKEFNLMLDVLEAASDEFPPLVEFKEIVERFMKNTMTYVKNKEEIFAEEIKNTEEELKEMRNFIKFQEENQAEL